MKYESSSQALVPEVTDRYVSIYNLTEKFFTLCTDKVRAQQTIILANYTYFFYERINLQKKREHLFWEPIKTYAKHSEKIFLHILAEAFQIKDLREYVMWMYSRDQGLHFSGQMPEVKVHDFAA